MFIALVPGGLTIQIQNLILNLHCKSESKPPNWIEIWIAQSSNTLIIVSVSVGKMNRIFGRNRIYLYCRIFGRGRIFGFGLGRYRDFPITSKHSLEGKISSKVQYSLSKTTGRFYRESQGSSVFKNVSIP